MCRVVIKQLLAILIKLSIKQILKIVRMKYFALAKCDVKYSTYKAANSLHSHVIFIIYTKYPISPYLYVCVYCLWINIILRSKRAFLPIIFLGGLIFLAQNELEQFSFINSPTLYCIAHNFSREVSLKFYRVVFFFNFHNFVCIYGPKSHSVLHPCTMEGPSTAMSNLHFWLQ